MAGKGELLLSWVIGGMTGFALCLIVDRHPSKVSLENNPTLTAEAPNPKLPESCRWVESPDFQMCADSSGQVIAEVFLSDHMWVAHLRNKRCGTGYYISKEAALDCIKKELK